MLPDPLQVLQVLQVLTVAVVHFSINRKINHHHYYKEIVVVVVFLLSIFNLKVLSFTLPTTHTTPIPFLFKDWSLISDLRRRVNDKIRLLSLLLIRFGAVKHPAICGCIY